jgi:hypothetical protein
MLTFLLVGCGQKKSAISSPEIQTRLAAIRDAGEPTTPAETEAWYVEPPTNENAAPLYVQAFAVVDLGDTNSVIDLEKNRQALELLHRAAERTQCRYPVHLKDGQAAMMTHLPPISNCALLLEREAIVNATKGRTGPAIQSVLDGLRLARSLESEPTLISQMRRLKTIANAMAGFDVVANSGTFSESDLARLQTAFEEAENADAAAMARGYAGDRCATVDMFVMSTREAAMCLRTVGIETRASGVAAYRRSSTNLADLAFCLDQFSNIVAMAKMPFPDCLNAVDRWAAQLDDPRSKGYLVSSSAHFINSAKQLGNEAGILAELRTARVAMAIERYRLAHNTLPANLNALVPKYLSAVPVDPFDGKPLRYKKGTPKGYAVYSVGFDRQDDNGTKLTAKTPRGAKYDVVFAMVR